MPDDPQQGGAPMPETAAEEEAPKMILPGDPDGRQPGNPNDPIDLPPELLHQPAPRFAMMAGPVPPTEEEMLRAMGITQPAAGHSQVPQTAPVRPRPPPPPPPQEAYEFTADGRYRWRPGMADWELVPPSTPAAFGGGALVDETTGYIAVEEPVIGAAISEQTRLEMEAGRALVLRNQGLAGRNRQIAAQAAARKLATRAPADNEDLSYNIPKF